MVNTSSCSSSSSEESTTYKRRKVRKGTHSCWECKRQKMRCASRVGAKCEGCIRRGTECVSQEFPEPARNSQQLADRLGRLEEALSQLPGTGHPNVPSLASPQTNHELNTSGRHGQETAQRERLQPPMPSLEPQIPAIAAPRALPRADDGLTNTLLAAWPHDRDLELILDAGRSVGSAGIFHGLIFSPYPQLSQILAPPRQLLQLPAPGSHPVLYARKLLILGSFLQSFTRTAATQLQSAAINLHDVISRAIEAAARVTSNDEIISTSVEGVECVMAESMFYNNAGNLRRAYLSMRRALVMAQMIGLDRGPSSASLRFLDPANTRRRIAPEYMWFRIVQSDRYLSLMLGQPQGAPGAIGLLEQHAGTDPMERLEGILSAAGGLILQRNRHGMRTDMEETKEIDNMLLEGAALMTPQWWLRPELNRDTGAGGDDVETLRAAIRLVNQFAHYHLLTRLHLPYLLRHSTVGEYDYSTITCIAACRELLSLFVSFRSGTSGCYCRGVDFLALIASTALCLGHINGRLNGGRNYSWLAHQRLSDRGMMERVLESMQQEIGDGIATKIAGILGHLLVVEHDVANNHGSYKTNLSHGRDGGEREGPECSGGMFESEGGKVLRIYIPHLGVIQIQCHAASDGDPASTTTAGGHPRDNASSRGGDSSLDSGQWFAPESKLSEDDWVMQGVDIALFDSLFPKGISGDAAN